jgi:hypothetical protein
MLHCENVSIAEPTAKGGNLGDEGGRDQVHWTLGFARVMVSGAPG